MAYHQKYLSSSVLAISAFGALLLCAPSQGLAVSILGGTLDNYAVLAYAGVTCVPTCNIGGNVGSDPIPAAAAFNFISGGIVDNANAGTAQTELTAAVFDVNNAGSFSTITAGNLDAFMGGVITPGNYEYAGVATLVGGITLDGGPTSTRCGILSSTRSPPGPARLFP